jgi:hypothetical protein
LRDQRIRAKELATRKKTIQDMITQEDKKAKNLIDTISRSSRTFTIISPRTKNTTCCNFLSKRLSIMRKREPMRMGTKQGKLKWIYGSFRP